MQELTSAVIEAIGFDVRRLERLSANLANALTPGYKREIALASRNAARAAAVANAAPVFDVQRDMRPGTLKATGQPLDVALVGPGFFEIATDNGPAYTRQGQWQIDARGRLLTSSGHAVLSSIGEVVLSGTSPVIDAKGLVSEAGKALARLNIVDFEDAVALTHLQDGVFAAGRKARTVHEDALQVLQGHVENSNVSAQREMVELTRSMRHFESMLRALQARDEMAGTTLRRLGDF